MRVDSNVSARRRADGEACNKLRVEFGTFLGDVLSELPDRMRLLNLRDNLSEKFRRPQIKGSMGLRFHVVDNLSNDAAADEPQLLWVGHDDSLLDSLVMFDRAFEGGATFTMFAEYCTLASQSNPPFASRGAALVVNISSGEAFTAAEKLKSLVLPRKLAGDAAGEHFGGAAYGDDNKAVGDGAPLKTRPKRKNALTKLEQMDGAFRTLTKFTTPAGGLRFELGRFDCTAG
ncbi:hypothetical protein M885DRAFT_626923 [Pelagophyceae sp. CCMP2097]|nr:hypothetical protein M885DRAFT_626923 [Pelagophyceae sp. CCMP2097]